MQSVQSNCETGGKLEWYVCDVVTGEGFDQSPLLSSNNSFDCIIDKGTLDAIMVEGSAYTALMNIYDLLKVGGQYLLCSLSSPELMMPMMSAPALNYRLFCHQQCNVKKVGLRVPSNGIHSDNATSEMTGTIIVCEKQTPSLYQQNSSSSERLTALQMYEDDMLNKFFQHDHSLLTDQFLSHLRTQFHGVSGTTGILPLTDAYRKMFVEVSGDFHECLGTDYTDDLFLEDIGHFMAGLHGKSECAEDLILLQSGLISLDCAVAFLKSVQ
jgi:hypothetical protein